VSRPLRLEFAGALYHVTSRGDRREAMYVGDEDREDWLAVLALVCERFNWVVNAYCQRWEKGIRYRLARQADLQGDWD
jgi:putative transposase